MEKVHEQLPTLPGVYLFKKDHELLYVGKAKSIRKRVASYFNKKDQDWKVQSLIQEHTHLEHIVTHTEAEALLLEAQLIQEHNPKYNVLLKSGQPFVYLLFTQEDLPRLELVRNKKKKGTYFGPFLHRGHARGVHQYLLRTFKLRICTKKIENGCLDYHLGNCAGSCKNIFDVADYCFRMRLAKDLLRGYYKESLKALEQQMQQYCADKEFEKAKRLHEYVQNLETIFDTLKARFSEDKYAKEVFTTTSPLSEKTKDYTHISSLIQQNFGLSKAPRTIDCFDISHFQSSQLVGSCIRFTNGVPEKNKFRRFIIKTLTQQNDYAALQEIVTRRYRNPADFPDLIIVDGGKGQLNMVQKVLPAQQDCISLAKREERVFCPAIPDGIVIDIKDPAAQLIIALRDYAHHFAIEFHRLRRRKLLQKESA